MNLEIYQNNAALKSALCGLIPQICRAARRDAINLSPNTLRRHCQPFREETGASFYSKTKAIIFYLHKINPARARFLMSDLFAALPERAKKVWKREEWLDRVFDSIGRLQALAVRGNWEKLLTQRFELADLLTAEMREESYA